MIETEPIAPVAPTPVATTFDAPVATTEPTLAVPWIPVTGTEIGLMIAPSCPLP